MATQREVFGAVFALQFIVAATVVFLFVPLEASLPLIPPFLILAFALCYYLTRRV